MDILDEVLADRLGDRRTWLVTGAAGFIGSALVEALLKAGQSVVGLDDFSTGYRRNIDDVAARTGDSFANFRLIEGDVRDQGRCAEACSGADYVLHHAAVVSVPLSVERPLHAHSVNVGGTMALLEASRLAGVRRFVFASSSAVYGDVADFPQREESIGRPLSPYAANKRTNEIDAALYSNLFGMGTVGLRYFNIFGPRQDPKGAYAAVIPNWIERMLAGDEVPINGSGEICRDFCFVGDVVRANLLAATGEGGSGEVFNIASGRTVTLEQLFNAIRGALGELGVGYSRDPVMAPARPGDIWRSGAETKKARKLLDFEAMTSLEDGLRATAEYFVKKR